MPCLIFGFFTCGDEREKGLLFNLNDMVYKKDRLCFVTAKSLFVPTFAMYIPMVKIHRVIVFLGIKLHKINRWYNKFNYPKLE